MLSFLLWLYTLLFLETNEEASEEEETQEEEEELARKPQAKIAALQDHVNRLHRRLKERDDTIKHLEERQDGPNALAEALRASQLQVAFLQHVIAHPDRFDIETAWDLGIAKGFFDVVSVDDKGEVSGMEDAFGKLLDRYPWLTEDFVDDEDDGAPKGPPRPKTGTGPRPSASAAMGAAQMRDRFPALKRRR